MLIIAGFVLHTNLPLVPIGIVVLVIGVVLMSREGWDTLSAAAATTTKPAT